jgi:hypothetical protein
VKKTRAHEGMVTSSLSFNKRNTSDDSFGKQVENYYGDKEFIVKVQIGLGRIGSTIPNMMYDRLKKVNFAFDDDVVKRKIKTDGVDTPGFGKVKGYVRAKHEPNGQVRIFLDNMPDQRPSW